MIFLIGGPFGSGLIFEARVDKNITTELMKNVPPTTIDIDLVADKIEFESLSFAPAIAEKTSGAPFPNASNVTPAKESDNLNRLVIVSSAGERYSSAVDANVYIPINIRRAPTGMKA